MNDDEAPTWQLVEVAGIVLHIPWNWDVFRFHGQWFVKDESGNFENRDDHLERSSGPSVPLNTKG